MQGGPERVVLDSVCGRAFVVTERGIYYTNAEEGLNLVTLRPFDPKTGKSHQLGRSDRRLATIRGMTVSPDGSTILVSANERWGADLMMVENFR